MQSIHLVGLAVAFEIAASDRCNRWFTRTCSTCGVEGKDEDCCMGVCPVCQGEQWQDAELALVEREIATRDEELVVGLRERWERARVMRENRLAAMAAEAAKRVRGRAA
jgi:hypothetical protein